MTSATPAPPPTPHQKPEQEGGGQVTSQERGSHTHNKKNPGKRPHQGG